MRIDPGLTDFLHMDGADEIAMEPLGFGGKAHDRAGLGSQADRDDIDKGSAAGQNTGLSSRMPGGSA